MRKADDDAQQQILIDLMPLAGSPVIDGREIQLGDLVSFDADDKTLAMLTKAARVKGWSPDHRYLLIAWAGIVPIDRVQWASLRSPDAEWALKHYKPVTENRWDEYIKVVGFVYH